MYMNVMMYHGFFTDFGFLRRVGAGFSPVTTPCGSLSYAAPELLSGQAGSIYDGKKVDIWSM